MKNGITLVYAGSTEGATPLRRITDDAGWRLEECRHWRLALDLADDLGATVFIYEREANPTEWIEALERTLNMRVSPAFLMISRFADEKMWADLLVGCGYDLLLSPLEPAEVLRTVGSAHAHHKKQAVAVAAHAN